MMKQIFKIILAGTQFALQNGGYGTCSASYQGGFVMIGGSNNNGKVDRWEVNNKII